MNERTEEPAPHCAGASCGCYELYARSCSLRFGNPALSRCRLSFCPAVPREGADPAAGGGTGTGVVCAGCRPRGVCVPRRRFLCRDGESCFRAVAVVTPRLLLHLTSRPLYAAGRSGAENPHGQLKPLSPRGWQGAGRCRPCASRPRPPRVTHRAFISGFFRTNFILDCTSPARAQPEWPAREVACRTSVLGDLRC